MPLRRHPVADLGALEVHREKLEASAREDHHRYPGVSALRRKDRHCGRRHVVNRRIRPARDHVRSLGRLYPFRRQSDPFHIGNPRRPDLDLLQTLAAPASRLAQKRPPKTRALKAGGQFVSFASIVK